MEVNFFKEVVRNGIIGIGVIIGNVVEEFGI